MLSSILLMQFVYIGTHSTDFSLRTKAELLVYMHNEIKPKWDTINEKLSTGYILTGKTIVETKDGNQESSYVQYERVSTAGDNSLLENWSIPNDEERFSIVSCVNSKYCFCLSRSPNQDAWLYQDYSTIIEGNKDIATHLRLMPKRAVVKVPLVDGGFFEEKELSDISDIRSVRLDQASSVLEFAYKRKSLEFECKLEFDNSVYSYPKSYSFSASDSNGLVYSIQCESSLATLPDQSEFAIDITRLEKFYEKNAIVKIIKRKSQYKYCKRSRPCALVPLLLA